MQVDTFLYVQGVTLERAELAVSPGLRLKYTNRSGESLAYSDEGFVDLSHVKVEWAKANSDPWLILLFSKDLNLCGEEVYNGYPEHVRLSLHKSFGSGGGGIQPKILKLVYGGTLAENR